MRTVPALPRPRLSLAIRAALVCTALLAACHRQPVQSRGPGDLPPPPTLTIFATGEIHNATEPCGCTSDPLGDVARVAGLLHASRAPALLLDAGGLRYRPEALSAEQRRQARLKADFLEQTWGNLGVITGVQPEDFHGSAGELAGVHRIAANLSGVPADVPLSGTELHRVGPVRVGVIGIAPQDEDAEMQWPAGISASDPLAAARAGVVALRKEGAQVVVALTGLPRQKARRLLRSVQGLDLVIAGGRIEEGIEEAEPGGDGLLVVPAREAQRVVRIDLYGTPAPGGHYALYHGKEALRHEQERLRGRRQIAREQLDRLLADPAADPAFVKSTQDELAHIEEALQAADGPARPPKGAYAVVELLPMSKALQRDPAVAQAMAALDRKVGEENLRACPPAPPDPPPGQPSFVGTAACAGECHWHDDAVALWKKTVHAHAWQTLVDGGKQLSLDCVGCHAVGFGEPGGSNLRTLTNGTDGGGRGAALRDVGCENCHGAGSLHVKSEGKTKMPVPAPVETRCQICHTREHSDTFQFQAYLRDILGPGHGEERREALGPGSTGHELRQAALALHKETP